MQAVSVAVGIAAVLAGVFVFYVFLSGFFWGAGYEPTSARRLKVAAEMLGLGRNDVVYDLGCGFGGALLFFARNYDCGCVGVEIDPLKASVARWRVARAGLSPRVRVATGNIFDFNLGEARRVFVFLWPRAMPRLKEKVLREMPPGSRVASYVHRFEGWTPERSADGIHLYVVGE